ncbi:MAG: PIG-L family deacetylase [Clostridiales bacterium]|nr:PIG-L family deacetylase [Clostridiales bacterium]
MKSIKLAAFLLAVLLLSGGFSIASQAEDGTAKLVSGKCSYSYTGRKKQIKNVYDNRINSCAEIPARDGKPAELSVKWGSDVKVSGFYLQWTREAPAHIRKWFAEDETLIGSEEILSSRRLDQWITVPEGSAEMVISCAESMEISECGAYGPGELPKTINIPKDTPKKLDYLIISAHPDDDQLFLGAVIPVYGAERGYNGTVLYMTCRKRNRYEEALNGVRVAGLTNLPLFAFKKDGGPDYDEVRKFWDYDETVTELVRYFREFRPDVVVTHDLKGEYGHALHRITSEATIDAVTAAADPSYDPESIEEYGTWQVKKLYIHLYPENKLTIDMRQPLEAFNGRTALDVAKAAYSEHKSQQYLWFYVSDEGAYSAAEYGLAFTAIGYDTPGKNDLFEHIHDDGDREITANAGEKTDVSASSPEKSEDYPELATTEETKQSFDASQTGVSEGMVTPDPGIEAARHRKEAFCVWADDYGTVHFKFDRTMRSVYISKTLNPPKPDSEDWVPVEGMTAAVWKTNGSYNAFVLDNENTLYGPVPITVNSINDFSLGGAGLKPPDGPIGDILAERGFSLDEINRRIADAAMSAGLYSRAAVSAAAVTTVSSLAEAGLGVPYRSAGRYSEKDLFGIAPEWGAPLPKPESDNNGKYYVYGMHCHASTVFAFKQAGLNITSEGVQDEAQHYGRLKTGKSNKRNRRYLHAGDMLKTETTHTMLIVERQDTNMDGKDDSFLVLEMVNPIMVLRLVPFKRSYDGFSMQAVFDDTGMLKSKAAYWPDTFRIPETDLPETYKSLLELQEPGNRPDHEEQFE